MRFFVCDLCYASFAMQFLRYFATQSLLCKLGYAIIATHSLLCHLCYQSLLCDLCYASFAMLSLLWVATQSLPCNLCYALQRNLCYAIFAMLCYAIVAMQSLLCNLCYANFALQSFICVLCYWPVKGHWPKRHVAMHAWSCAHSYVARQSATRAWSGAHSSCLRVAGLPGATSESGKSWKPDLLTLNPVCFRANLGPWVARSAFGSSGFERTDWWEGACVAFWKQSEPPIVVRLAIENDKNAKPIATTVALSLYIYIDLWIYSYMFFMYLFVWGKAPCIYNL
jgi:hypothetical protein